MIKIFKISGDEAAVETLKNGIERMVDDINNDRPVNQGKPWTHQQESKLIEYMVEGQDLDTIAKFMGRTRGSIICRFNVMFDSYEWRQNFPELDETEDPYAYPW